MRGDVGFFGGGLFGCGMRSLALGAGRVQCRRMALMSSWGFVVAKTWRATVLLDVEGVVVVARTWCRRAGSMGERSQWRMRRSSGPVIAPAIPVWHAGGSRHRRCPRGAPGRWTLGLSGAGSDRMRRRTLSRGWESGGGDLEVEGRWGCDRAARASPGMDGLAGMGTRLYFDRHRRSRWDDCRRLSWPALGAGGAWSSRGCLCTLSSMPSSLYGSHLPRAGS